MWPLVLHRRGGVYFRDDKYNIERISEVLSMVSLSYARIQIQNISTARCKHYAMAYKLCWTVAAVSQKSIQKALTFVCSAVLIVS